MDYAYSPPSFTMMHCAALMHPTATSYEAVTGPRPMEWYVKPCDFMVSAS